MLKELRAAKAGPKLVDTDKAKVDDLEAKAVERRNADDDIRSDKFSTDAMTIRGSQNHVTQDARTMTTRVLSCAPASSR